MEAILSQPQCVNSISPMMPVIEQTLSDKRINFHPSMDK